MHKGNLAVDEAADEDIVGIAQRLKDRENLMAFGMSPPASLDGLVGNELSEPRNWSLGCCEHHTLFRHERNCLFGCHPISLSAERHRCAVSSGASPLRVGTSGLLCEFLMT